MKKQSVVLSIDTTSKDTACVSLEINGKRFQKISRSRMIKSQMVLPIIESMLSEHLVKLSDISEIAVATGPGSFTGVRVGLSVANALSTLLNVPVNGKKTLATPTYS